MSLQTISSWKRKKISPNLLSNTSLSNINKIVSFSNINKYLPFHNIIPALQLRLWSRWLSLLLSLFSATLTQWQLVVYIFLHRIEGNVSSVSCPCTLILHVFLHRNQTHAKSIYEIHLDLMCCRRRSWYIVSNVAFLDNEVSVVALFCLLNPPWKNSLCIIEFFTVRPNCTFLAHIYIRQILVDPFKYNWI